MSPLGCGSVLKYSDTRTGVPSKVVQGFQFLFLEAEHRSPAAQTNHVDPEGILQVGGDLAQHLVRLDHLHRRAGPVQPQGLAKLRYAADMHPRDRTGAQVERNVVGLPMMESRFNPLA